MPGRVTGAAADPEHAAHAVVPGDPVQPFGGGDVRVPGRRELHLVRHDPGDHRVVQLEIDRCALAGGRTAPAVHGDRGADHPRLLAPAAVDERGQRGERQVRRAARNLEDVGHARCPFHSGLIVPHSARPEPHAIASDQLPGISCQGHGDVVVGELDQIRQRVLQRGVRPAVRHAVLVDVREHQHLAGQQVGHLHDVELADEIAVAVTVPDLAGAVAALHIVRGPAQRGGELVRAAHRGAVQLDGQGELFRHCRSSHLRPSTIPLMWSYRAISSAGLRFRCSQVSGTMPSGIS